MATEYRYDVFISYSRKDYVDENKTIIPGNIVSQIKGVFDANHISYWMDEKGIYSGDEFAKIIARYIRQSRVFLFVSTANSNASEWTSDEIATARMYKKKIIPFKYDDSFYNEDVIIFIAKLDFIDHRSNPEQSLNKLVSSVKKYLADIEDIRKREEELQLKIKQEEEERKRKAEEEARKEKFREEIKQKAQDCRHLIIQQQAIVQQLHAKNISIGNETKECPVCKKVSSIETTFCEKCGFQFPSLYAIDGNESYPFDNRLLVTAKANYDAIAFTEKEKERLEKKVTELTDSYEKVSIKCERQLKIISQKQTEVVSCRNKYEALSAQLKESKKQSEKLIELSREKEELVKRITGLQAIADKQKEWQIELEAYKAKVLVTNKEIQCKDDTIKELKKKIEDLTSELSENNRKRDAQIILRCPKGAIKGIFSVSPIKKVFFSKGNLQYQIQKDVWRFAENQFDIAEKISSYYEHWIDLYGWGTGENPTNYYRDSSLYRSFVDWGKNYIINGDGRSDLWYTLTDVEWTYIFDKRCTDSGIRYAKACVNKVNGVILLPDDWNPNSYRLNSTNNPEADYYVNTINLSQWIGLERLGVVFLPAAGYRIEDMNYLIGVFGHYWSASYSPNSYYSYNLYFNSGLLNSSYSEYRHYGFSVRLVCSAM
jgi:hypothetical protein